MQAPKASLLSSSTHLTPMQSFLAALLYPFFWLILKVFYRVKVVGRENVPTTGPALIVCNHVSWLDGLFLYMNSPRRVRFLVWAPYLKTPFVRWLLKLGRVIPISSEGGPRQIVEAIRLASDALKQGELVGIFAEGALTRNGFMLPFKRGMEQILKRAQVPILPACLDRLWGSIFSWRFGKLLWKWPRQIPYPVTLSFGSVLPPDTPAWRVRQAVQELMADSFNLRKNEHKPLHRQFLREVCHHPFRPCLMEPGKTGRKLNYLETLTGAVCLSKCMKSRIGAAPMVGLLLPTVVGGCIANIAVSLLGKTAVNLNYTASQESINFSVKQCNLRTVFTSRLFRKKIADKVNFDFGPDVEVVELEEFAPLITKGARVSTFLTLLLLPRVILEYWVLKLGQHQATDLATVIYSSGSTGEPKGVMLNHHNLVSNIESVAQAIDILPTDRLLSVLPLFHSFGFTVCFWLPIITGASAVCYPDPRQPKDVGDACREFQATIFTATPTFLRFYIRRCDKDDFKSCRLIITGAEKLPRSVQEEFKNKFGIEPEEGYGTTELSPVTSINIPDTEKNGVRQVGSKPGTIGQPVPGVAVKIIDPETEVQLPPGQPGMLLVYGPNVMEGYLGKPELTRSVMRGKWYVTGDIAKLDDDGFITITDRLSRFSKIAGEMVPHVRIEDELHAILGTAERVFAVVGLPDEKRGERLVVLYTANEGLDLGGVQKKLSTSGLPNLWIPDERNYHQIEEMPVLGSGKLDLQKLKRKAVEVEG
jgi:acyl-[acyl-carrier-protein]-phospholipid O-acyltransferase/long-chain-fatty-acid--[acyl-carrier-protein] ligase